jgi:hypothetical protein
MMESSRDTKKRERLTSALSNLPRGEKKISPHLEKGLDKNPEVRYN